VSGTQPPRTPSVTALERHVEEIARGLFGRPVRDLTRRQWADLQSWRAEHPYWRPGDPVA
jgi:hypothetical protein